MDNAVLRLLGLCKRARKLVCGERDIGAAVRSGICLIITASDTAQNTLERLEAHSRTGNSPLITLPYTREELGRALGINLCAAAAVTDKGLAEKIIKILSDKTHPHN